MKKHRFSKWALTWSIFGIVTVGYISVSFLNSDSSWISIWLQVGGIFVSLSAMVMIMLQNNETIQETTSLQINNHRDIANRQINESIEHAKQYITALEYSTKNQIDELNKNTDKQIIHFKEQTTAQIESFAEQCNNIVSKLEDVTEELMKLSEVNLKILDLESKYEDEKLKLKKTEITLFKEKEQESIQLNKPTLHVRFEIHDYWFYKHLYVFIYNQGNSAKNTTINFSFRDTATNQSTRINSELIKHIDALSQHSFRVGRAKNYSRFDKVFIQIDTRDKSNRYYRGESSIDFIKDTWYLVNLYEFNKALT